MLPKVIAIDEFKGGVGNERLQTIIVGVEKKEIIENLPERRRVSAMEEFCDTGNIQIVVRICITHSNLPFNEHLEIN